MNQQENNIILFDGVCNFCNSTINFVIDRDKNGKFLFASLQSVKASEILKRFDCKEKKILDSVLLVKDGKLYKKSSAALEIAKELSGIWPLFYGFKIIPWFLRDLVYDLIARNRYKLFGKRDACRVPEPEIKSRFLG